MHPQVEALRRRWLAEGVRPVRELTVEEARAAEEAELGKRTAAPEPVADVLDLAVPGPEGDLPARLYRPKAPAPLPLLVYFYGGGWVMGSLVAADPVCRRLANATPCAVLSVQYRRAPEHRFPAAVEDCYAATRWAFEHSDDGRMAVGGASAGGNLAAAVTLLARERGGPQIRFQLLVYPPLDYRADTPSSRETGPIFLSRDDVTWCWQHYLAREGDGENPLASPLRAADLSGLPPALVITAELDPLRDEGELYAERLTAAGVPAEHVRFDGVMHAFFSMNGVLEAADRAQELTAGTLRRALS